MSLSVQSMKHCAPKVWTVVLLLGACSTSPTPTRVTYSLGGTMSGPFDASADLVAGTAKLVAPPQGRRTAPAITSVHPIEAADLREMKRLSRQVLADGPFDCKGHGGMLPDALGSFEFEVGSAKTRRSLSSATCMTSDATALLQYMYCTAKPDGWGCRPCEPGEEKLVRRGERCWDRSASSSSSAKTSEP